MDLGGILGDAALTFVGRYVVSGKVLLQAIGTLNPPGPIKVRPWQAFQDSAAFKKPPGYVGISPMHNAGHVGNEEDLPGSGCNHDRGHHLLMEGTLGRHEQGTGLLQGKGLGSAHTVECSCRGKLGYPVGCIGNVKFRAGVSIIGVLQGGSSPHMAQFPQAAWHDAVDTGSREVPSSLHSDSGTETASRGIIPGIDPPGIFHGKALGSGPLLVVREVKCIGNFLQLLVCGKIDVPEGILRQVLQHGDAEDHRRQWSWASWQR